MNNEKLEELRQDCLHEQALRTDWDFALEQLAIESVDAYVICEALNTIQSRLESYGWQIGREDLIKELMQC